jgi:hypothetical protein
MPYKLLSLERRNKITEYFLSHKWYSVTPWHHKGVNQPYFSHKTEHSSSVVFTYLYIGPLAILSGRWKEDNATKTRG